MLLDSMARRRPVRHVVSRQADRTPLTQPVTGTVHDGPVDQETIDVIQAEMQAVQHEIRSGELRIAAQRLRRLIREARAKGLGHAEALWALAVCLDGIGDADGALAAIEASVQQDPTALVALRTRSELLGQQKNERRRSAKSSRRARSPSRRD